MPYKFYDVDKNGNWREHQFTKDEAKVMFWAFLILGWVIPIVIAIFSA